MSNPVTNRTRGWNGVAEVSVHNLQNRQVAAVPHFGGFKYLVPYFDLSVLLLSTFFFPLESATPILISVAGLCFACL